MNFGGGQILDPTLGLQRTLSGLQSVVGTSIEQDIKRKKLEQDAIDNAARLNIQRQGLGLREAAETRMATTFGQEQEDRRIQQLVGAVDTSDLATTRDKWTTPQVAMTPEEQTAIVQSKLQQAGEVTVGGTDAERYTQDVDRLSAERARIAKLSAIEDSKSMFRGIIPTTEAYKQARPYSKSDQALDLANTDAKLDALGAEFSKKYDIGQVAGLSELSDKDFMKAGKSIKSTVATDRKSYKSELDAAFKEALGKNPDNAIKAAVNKAKADKMKVFDDQANTLQKAAQDMRLFREKTKFKAKVGLAAKQAAKDAGLSGGDTKSLNAEFKGAERDYKRKLEELKRGWESEANFLGLTGSWDSTKDAAVKQLEDALKAHKVRIKNTYKPL